ncbi:MAG: DUF460 domain-containing protein [Desulfurococcales archaeon]|nr:DUF460 domain-containing protein [Desulfurococcales archaeon]
MKNRDLYMGIDIREGSPLSSEKPRYSVVLIDDEGKPIVVHSSVTLSRAIRLAWDYHPKRIGLDNPFELARNTSELERILGFFPPETEILQVTLDRDTGYQKLRSIAREQGLNLGREKLGSVKTAYLLAFLAREGVGTPIRVLEEKTIITVSKARSPKGGGFSQQRLQRRVRASVHIAAMRVKEALDKAGIEYDMSYRKSVGGLESAVFTVYAPRTRLYGLVRPHRGMDYTITIKTVYKTRLNLLEDSVASDRPIIVGVDPGVTTGLAVLDLRGKPIYLASSKDLDRGTIIEEISRLGKPVLFAIDVSTVPESVRWLAAKFGAAIYSPSVDLETSEKREIASRVLGEPPQDTHQRDALAAAYKAYLFLKNKLDHVEKQVRRMGVGIDVEKVKENVIRGVTVAEAIEKAIEDMLTPTRTGPSGKKPPAGRDEASRSTGRVEELSRRIEALEAEKRVLERRLREYERRIRHLEIEVESAFRRAKAEVMKDSEVRRLRERLQSLEQATGRLEQRLKEFMAGIDALRNLVIRVGRGEVIVLRPLPSLTPRSIRKSEEELGPLLPGEVILLQSPVVDSSALRVLLESQIRGVLVPEGGVATVIERYGIPALPLSSLDEGVRVVEGVYYVSSVVVELLEERRRVLEEYRRAEIDLERIITEYRMSRRHGSQRD